MAASAFVVFLTTGNWCVAQTASDTAALPSGRLSVRPREMATGTRNPAAGMYALDSFPNFLVYVPPQCVGAVRCPLVVSLLGGGEHSKGLMEQHRPLAEKYGTILFVPEPTTPGMWDAHRIKRVPDPRGRHADIPAGPFANPDVRNIDAALKQILRKYAVDPEKIALNGSSNGGFYSLFLGRSNLDVFSRVAAFSAVGNQSGPGPDNAATQFWVSWGLGEWLDSTIGPIMTSIAVGVSTDLRQDGHAVQHVLGLRQHSRNPREAELMWQWLRKSWTASDKTMPPAEGAATDSVAALTPAALASMTAFWDSYQHEPDSIRSAVADPSNLIELRAPVGQLSVLWTGMLNMPAAAAKYSSIAADLAKAGLTAEQEEAYRVALISAHAAMLIERAGESVPAASATGRNVALLKGHQNEADVLWANVPHGE